MDAKERLLREYDAREDAIEANAFSEMWGLADWLVDKVPNPGRGGDHSNTARAVLLTVRDVEARGRRSQQQLNAMRKVAEATRPNRISGVSVRAYEAALVKAGWDLVKANALLLQKGTKLRDQAGSMESVDATIRNIQKMPPQARAQVGAAAIVDDDPDKTQAIASHMPDETLDTIDTATTTERYLRERGRKKKPKQPPPDAASHSLGGIGPAATAAEIHRNALEPRINRVYSALAFLKTHVQARGANLLTDVDEFDDLDERVQEMSELFAFMLDAIDIAKKTKLANEQEGAAR